MTILAIQKKIYDKYVQPSKYQRCLFFFSQNKTKKLSNFFVDHLDLKMTNN